MRNKTELFLGSSQQCFSSFRERGQHTVLKHRPLEHLAGHRTEVGVGLNKNQLSFLLHHDKLSTSKVTPSSKKLSRSHVTFYCETFCKNYVCSAKTMVEKVRRHACRVLAIICSSSPRHCLSHRNMTQRSKMFTRKSSRNIIHRLSDTQAAHRG